MEVKHEVVDPKFSIQCCPQIWLALKGRTIELVSNLCRKKAQKWQTNSNGLLLILQYTAITSTKKKKDLNYASIPLMDSTYMSKIKR